ncbi:MAG: hypothetical protein QM811_27100 [Pirellulales bacterium]
MAADLIDAGAKPAQIYGDLYEHDTLARLKLVGRILARTDRMCDDRLIYTAALREDFDATGAAPARHRRRHQSNVGGRRREVGRDFG